MIRERVETGKTQTQNVDTKLEEQHIIVFCRIKISHHWTYEVQTKPGKTDPGQMYSTPKYTDRRVHVCM